MADSALLETFDDSMPANAGEVKVITLGCRLNAYESEAMRKLAAEGGASNAVVINTCAVTNEAVRQARQSIRRARRDNPGAKVIVTGCAAQIDPQAFAAMPEVDLVLGNQEKMQAESWRAPALQAEGRVRVNDIQSARETAGHLIDGLEGRARAYVEVQNGCDHRCTFCIIPYGRGPSRSAPAGDVVAQIRRLAANGVSEIVLSGVDLTSWGGDLPGAPPFSDLVRRILTLVPELKRLRLSSLDASEVDDALIALFANEERLAPHLHLSLQAGDDLILKRMKRRHSTRQAEDLCGRLRQARPDIAFGADFIAGFPTETDEAAENTLSHVDACDLSYLHVFPFSPRTGTPAARMPQVKPPIVKARAAALRAKGEQALARHCESRVGFAGEALMEREGFGRLADFTPVQLSSSIASGIVRVRVESAMSNCVSAVPA
ncbi:MAG: tRNA (N(6)-L-threonylcarbamoyladenosine(37)-C(2))-methylthiotransferase MtaB [Caulobacterales bacterium]